MLRKFAAVSLLAVGAFAYTAPAFAKMNKALDPDADGTMTIDEAKAAAEKKFEMHDPDKDGTLDAKEATKLMSKPDFTMSDADKEGTLDKNEYMTAVESTFKKADTDNDGTLDSKELGSPAGKKLMRMIK